MKAPVVKNKKLPLVLFIILTMIVLVLISAWTDDLVQILHSPIKSCLELYPKLPAHRLSENVGSSPFAKYFNLLINMGRRRSKAVDVIL